MNRPPEHGTLTLSITAVELDTGISKDTLRVWERRYGFPRPGRDDHGERAYPLEQVERLRTIKRLLDAGHRPGQVVAMAPDELNRLADSTAAASERPPALASSAVADDAVADCLALIGRGAIDPLCQRLLREAHHRGLIRVIDELIAPLNTRVGDGWMQGQLAVFHEHLYTEAVQRVLRQLRSTMPPVGPDVRPHVLLATVPGEPHGIGLLMVEALLALEGTACWSLGVQTPVADIAQAAAALRIDIVALSFTACVTARQVTTSLQDLRSALPPATSIWAGGSAAALHRRRVDGVLAMKALDELPAALARWRADADGARL